MKTIRFIILSLVLPVVTFGQAHLPNGHRDNNSRFFKIVSPSSTAYKPCYLVLKKAGKTVSAFFENDEIACFSGKFWRQGRIDFIGDGFITIRNEKIPLSEIQLLRVKRRSLHFRRDGNMLIVGGLVFLAIDQINHIGQHYPTAISAPAAILGSSFIVTGIILKLLTKRQFRIGGKFSLITICP